MAIEPRVVIESRNLIGESPVWSVPEKSLYWVDVEGQSIQRWREADRSIQCWDIGEPIGCIGLRRGSGLVGARKSGFFFLDVDSGSIAPIADPEAHLPENRFNDGKVDRRGRFWAGTRNFVDTQRATGALYRLDADCSVHRMEEGLRCPNGMAWSPDNKLMYLCDTWTRRIYVYDFDIDDGHIGNRRLFVELGEADGFPDGLTVDAEGYVWNAHYNGWRITRYSPDAAVDHIVRMPVQHVTSVSFGGAPGTLFATTSYFRLSADERIAQPIAGNVFAMESGTQGISEPEFSG